MTRKHRLFALIAVMAVVMAAVLMIAPAALAKNTQQFLTVTPANSPYVVTQTTRLSVLVIQPGGYIAAPAGHEVTLTVNGVEQGGRLVTTAGVDTRLSRPGIYRGHLVLSITETNKVPYIPAGPPGQQPVVFPFRQALYLDATGVIDGKSVLAALIGKKPVSPLIKNVQIASKGQNFNGVYVAGGDYTLRNVKIALTGNGRSDFIGYGAAIVARGEATRLVVDRVDVNNHGVVRAAVIADGGANVVVKNSHLETHNGVLPADYVPTIDTAQMRSVPWMLSLSGNVRATNLLGTNTKASYINSYIASQGWGVLSTDGCITPTLTAINSTIAITGKDGYGSYGIGDATENFLGSTFNVATYATISRGSFLHYGDSTPAAVKALNQSLGLGLTAKELAAIPNKPTVVNSERFGIMWHGGGTLDVTGRTVFNTKKTTFLDKGQAISISVDGSKGVKLNPGNGVLMQLMDDDDPGPDFATMQNTKVYHEPPYPPAKIGNWDLTSAADAAVATFSHIALSGDFFNSITSVTPMGPPPGAGPPGPPPSPVGKNLVLTFDDSSLVGVISATEAHHAIADIYPPEVPGHALDYRQLGEVTNTARQAINNGVVVTLNGSSWTVDGASHLTKLVMGAGSSIAAPAGHALTMMVDPDFDGPQAAALVVPAAGNTYTGYITLTIS